MSAKVPNSKDNQPVSLNADMPAEAVSRGGVFSASGAGVSASEPVAAGYSSVVDSVTGMMRVISATLKNIAQKEESAGVALTESSSALFSSTQGSYPKEGAEMMDDALEDMYRDNLDVENVTEVSSDTDSKAAVNSGELPQAKM